MHITININGQAKNPKTISLTDICNRLHEILGYTYATSAFFSPHPHAPKSITFDSCSNQNKHNLLVCLIHLFFLTTPNVGWTAFDGMETYAGRIVLENYEAFWKFLQSLPVGLKEVGVSIQ